MKSYFIVIVSLFLLAGCQAEPLSKIDNNLPVDQTATVQDKIALPKGVEKRFAINGRTVELVEKPITVEKTVLINGNYNENFFVLEPLKYGAISLNFPEDGGNPSYLMSDEKTGKRFFVWNHGSTELSDDIEQVLILNSKPAFVGHDGLKKFLLYDDKKFGPYRDFEEIVAYNGTVAFQALDMQDKTGIFDGTTFRVDYDDVLCLKNIGGKLAYIGWKRTASGDKDGESFLKWGDETIASNKDPNIRMWCPFENEGSIAYPLYNVWPV